MCQRAVGQLDAFPAIVAVHGVIAAHDRRNLADAQLAHLLLQLAHVFLPAVRWRVPAIHEAMHKDLFDLVPLGHLQQDKQVMDVRVHAAIAQQAKKMQLPLPATLHRLLEQGHLLQLIVRNHQIDARDVHVHDSPGADIHVAYFAVAHLSFWQAHRWPGSLDQCVREFPEQFVVGRLARESNRVALRLRTVAPSIQHRQHNGFRSFSHGFLSR